MCDYSYSLPRPTMEGFLRRLDLKSLSELSEKEIMDAIGSACEFFGISYPAFVQDLSNLRFGCTMFLNVDPTSYEDDILYYNMKELAQLHVGTKEAFSLIMTHECAHRVLQATNFKGPNNGSWKHELAADYFMGIRAGMQNMRGVAAVKDGLGKTEGSKSHPAGFLRAGFINAGMAWGQTKQLTGQHIATNIMLSQFLQYFDRQIPVIKKEEKKYFNLIDRVKDCL